MRPLPRVLVRVLLGTLFALSAWSGPAPGRAEDTSRSAAASLRLYIRDEPWSHDLRALDAVSLADSRAGPAVALAGWRYPAPQQVLASEDGSTLAAVSTALSQGTHPRARDITVRIIEAWSGLSRASFHPPVTMSFNGLSPDGSQLYGFRTGGQAGAELYLLSTRDGSVVTRLQIDDPGGSRTTETDTSLYDAGAHRLYLLSRPQVKGQGSGPVTPDLVAYDLASGHEVGRLHLDGVQAGGAVTQQGNQAPVLTIWQPGLALSSDGSRVAVLDGTSDTLLLVDARRLTVLRSQRLSGPESVLQRLGVALGVLPEAALAKEWLGAELTARFSPDGRYLYVTGRKGWVDAGGRWTVDGLGVRAIDLATGQVAAGALPHAWVTALLPAPDGSAVYSVASDSTDGSGVTLRRHDPATLQVVAERRLADWPELYFTASPLLGAPGCRPASPMNQNEVRGTPVKGQLWGLVFGRLQVGQDVKIVWRMTGKGQFRLSATGPNGARVVPSWGPVLHQGSSWNRPGDEWGAGFTFPRAGCWQVHAGRANTAGDLWLQVAPAG